MHSTRYNSYNFLHMHVCSNKVHSLLPVVTLDSQLTAMYLYYPYVYKESDDLSV